jgi:translocation and assembly module TamB
MKTIGLLSSIGPWLVQDVKGDTWVDLALQGTWAAPDLGGEIILRGGSAYLPAAGVQLDNVNLHAKLASDRVNIEQLEVHSGSGVLNGHGELLFEGFALSTYKLILIGRNFQVFNFPELQVLCNPDLELSGAPGRLSVQGSVLIPVMAIRESKGTPEIQASKDVVMARQDKKRRELSFATDILVAVELGNDVTFKADGVETRLKGGAIVSMGSTGELLAHGEIQLVSGTYRAHGVNLQIRQGVLNYKGGVITNPDLRIFAAREVGTVLAGVQITGNAEAPVVSLYSRPAMPERDILGYMLMGRAIRTEEQETDILTMGATSLLPGGGTGLAELGITEIDIQGLFSGTGGVRLRRPITDKWELESTLGVESGVDLYYIIEFN